MNCELTYKTARANAKSTLLGRGVIDKFNTILDYSLFTKEANKFWQYAKDNYLSNLPSEERLLTSEDNKVIFNEDAFMRIDASKGVFYSANEKYRNSFNEFFQDRREESKDLYYQLNDNVNYQLKSINLLLSDKAKSLEKRLKQNKQFVGDNWNKIQTDLQIPKEQLELVKQVYDNLVLYSDDVLIEPSFEEIALHLGLDYSFTVKVDLAKDNRVFDSGYGRDEYGNLFIPSDNDTSSYYSNLTVPGGTNYTENEISTPKIIPSIKGHAQFATDNGLGWTRTDERVQYTEQDINSLIDILKKSGQLEINCK